MQSACYCTDLQAAHKQLSACVVVPVLWGVLWGGEEDY